jgi:hypothetical protein
MRKAGDKLFRYSNKSWWYLSTNRIDVNDNLLIKRFWSRMSDRLKEVK